MTSSRGPNASSVFQHPTSEKWITPTAGGSLRTIPRNNSLGVSKGGAAIEKFSGQISLQNSSSPQNKVSAFVNASPNVCMTNGVSPPPVLHTINRELSPVRWCDRKVDGVYLGRSGWVQVQQRSLEDSKGVFPCGSNSFSTLPSRKHFSDLNSVRLRSQEKKELNRPLNLPLPSKKRTVQENLFFEFESASPPSVTPIISPPPAFKDDGFDAQCPRQSMRKPFFSEEPSPLAAKAEISSSCSTKSRRSTLQSLLSAPSVSEPLPHRSLKTQSLEEDFSNRTLRERRFSYFGFHSLDNDFRDGGNCPVKANESDFFYNNYVTTEEKRNSYECDKDDGDDSSSEELTSNEYSSELKHPGEIEKNSSMLIRHSQRNPLRQERRTSSTYRPRSSSLDSTSSSGSSLDGRNFEKLSGSLRTNSKENQVFESENSCARDGKSFYVKRSRSLQLSEKRSPGESGRASHPSSGKSWDPMPPDYASFQNQAPGQFPQHMNHALVTASGDSIPVLQSGRQSLRSLSKITTCEEEQKKLIMEAEKEAKIISEFLNGTRSRAAARSLLMHRFLNRHEGHRQAEVTENIPPGTTCDGYFLDPDRRCKNKAAVCEFNHGRGNFSKKNKQSPSNTDLQPPTSAYSKSLTSVFRTFSNGIQARTTPSQNSESQRKKGRAESTRSGGSRSASPGQRFKTKAPNVSRFVNSSSMEKPPFGVLISQKQAAKIAKRQNVELETTGDQKQRVGESSSTSSSSSSPELCQADPSANSKNKSAISSASLLFEDHSKTPLEIFNFRSSSAPESDYSTSPGADQRSLSLPRSFLSERYKNKGANHRYLLRCTEEHERNVDELPTGPLLSRTAPTTPTRDLSRERNSESSDCIQCVLQPPSAPYSDGPPAFTFLRSARKITPEGSINEENDSLAYKGPFVISENPSEAVLKKLKKKFPLKYLKGKGNSEEWSGRLSHETESLLGYSSGTISAASSGLPQDDEKLLEKALRFTDEQSSQKKGIKNEKYGSHDSGIQMGNRGFIDSSESQDTDFQEDFDSPLMVRRRKIYGWDGFSKSPAEIFRQTSTAQSKTEVQWPNKMMKPTFEKGVRRTNSDLGNRKLFHLDMKSHGRVLGPYPSLRRGKLPSPDEAAILGKYLKTQLRRSLSQPSGLNEFPPLSRRPSTLRCFALSEDEKVPRGKNSEDECLSDSESSVASLIERKKSLDLSSRDEAAILAEAVWDHVAIESCELPFRAGDVIEVLDTRNWDWWWGATAECCGYFPSAFVRLRVNQEDTVEDCLAAMAKGKRISNRLRRNKSISLLSNDQVRSRVVRELLNTERDFVKILRDVKDGYIEECKRRADMFTPAQIATIFSNLGDILVFQEMFLKDLEAGVDRDFPYKSCIGQVFLTHAPGFRMYSDYCNSHPMAIATLQDLYQNNNYCKFFETCRLKQSLIEIPLDGYLLTPVQRICKYPLQLAELLKYTKPDHPDFKGVEAALETMRGVATLINERKRKMESLEKLAAWQQRVEGWEGEDLIDVSSQLIHQGEVVRITSGMWTTNITLFLFDHQIIYCKKDLLKRNVYIYKGRIFLDASFVIDLPDGKNQQLGVTVKYGLKICNNLEDKWLLFCCRSSEDKAKWLEALAEEKRLVAQNKEVDLDLPSTAKRFAKMAARTKKGPPCKSRHKTKVASNHEETAYRNCHSGTSKSKSNRRVGTWFTFGGVIKNSKTTPRQRTSLYRIT